MHLSLLINTSHAITELELSACNAKEILGINNNHIADPLHTTEYLAGNIFLPVVNNNNNSKFADKQSKLPSCSLWFTYFQWPRWPKQIITCMGQLMSMIYHPSVKWFKWSSLIFAFSEIFCNAYWIRSAFVFQSIWFKRKTSPNSRT